MDLLIDSSVWIAADRREPKVYTALAKLLHSKDHNLVTILPIQTEVCQGAKSEAEFQTLWKIFDAFQHLDITAEIWRISGTNYLKCRRRGMTLSTIDCLIATVAQYYQIAVWSEDLIFSKIKKEIDFPTYRP